MMAASASVLICTYRRPDALLACLAGLAAQSRAPDDVMLIVRPGDTATLQALALRPVDRLPWRIVRVHEPGLVAARNAGLAANGCDIVCVCDDDTVATPLWLERVLGHFAADQKLGGVGGRDRCHDGTAFDDRERDVVGHLQWWGRAIGNHHLGVGPPRKVDFLKGANMSFRADAIRGLWFDTRLRGIGAQPDDDLGFSLAVARRGWSLVYDPLASVDHYVVGDQSRSYVVRHGLPDPGAYGEGCFNHALTLWDQMGGVQRAVCIVWSVAIGSGTYPGFAQAVRFRLRGDPAAWRKYWINITAIVGVVRAGARAPQASPSLLLKTPKLR